MGHKNLLDFFDLHCYYNIAEIWCQKPLAEHHFLFISNWLLSFGKSLTRDWLFPCQHLFNSCKQSLKSLLQLHPTPPPPLGLTDVNNVQNMWDDFESKLVKVVDKVTPLTEFINRKVKTILPNSIKHKINKRKKLLNKWKEPLPMKLNKN